MYQKILLLAFFTISQLPFVFAQSQLAYITKEQANKALRYLQTQKEVILYSGCEKGDIARKVKISEVKSNPTPDRKGYYVIRLKGTIIATFNIDDQKALGYNENINESFSGTIDLTYVHVAAGGYFDEVTGRYIWDAISLGIHLGFECDPCIDPFDYPQKKRID